MKQQAEGKKYRHGSTEWSALNQAGNQVFSQDRPCENGVGSECFRDGLYLHHQGFM
jgi:hypothetical protein